MSTSVSYGMAALILLVMFVRESGHTVVQTILVRPAELGKYFRQARALLTPRLRLGVAGEARELPVARGVRRAAAGEAGAADGPE